MNNIEDDFIPVFNEEQADLYLASVYARAINPEELSVRYHYIVAHVFERALEKGYGSYAGQNIEAKLSDNIVAETFSKLRRNLYHFSAAKQYQQVWQLSSLINENATFESFRRVARKIFKDFNENYLKTEFVTAVGQSQMAREWVEVQRNKDLFPFLEYRTQRDARVRDEHAALDGIILPVDHKFWKQYHPKCGWRCRCFTVSHEKAQVTDLRKRDLSDLNDPRKFPDLFKMNPGAEGKVFDEKKHPYFRVARGHKKLKEQNFKMPRT